MIVYGFESLVSNYGFKETTIDKKEYFEHAKPKL